MYLLQLPLQRRLYEDVRGFADFFSEFYRDAPAVGLPRATRLVALCDHKPSPELRAFQVGWVASNLGGSGEDIY